MNQEIPQNLEAEKTIIISMIIDKEAISKVIGAQINVDDFYQEAYKHIFKAIIDLYEKDAAVDLVTLNNSLKENTALKQLGGATYLDELVESLPTTANVLYHVNIVIEKANKRKLINSLNDIISKTPGGANSSLELIENLETTLSTLKDSSSNPLTKEVEESTNHTVNKLLKEHKRLTQKEKIKTGFPKIDSSIMFMPTDFNIVQSMSNHGKTSLMLNFVYRFLFNNENVDCAFVTYETSKLKIQERLLNIISLNLEQKKYIDFNFGKYTYAKCPQTKKLYDDWHKKQRLTVLSNTELKKLKTLIKLTKKKNRVLILFLDYVQILDNDLKSEGWQKIKEVAYALEKLAVNEEIIIFAGSQVNEQRQTREGKDIYNAATNVIDLFNHSHDKLQNNKDHSKLYKEKIKGKSLISITIDKSKYFQTNKFEDYLLFDGFVFEENPYDKIGFDQSSVGNGKIKPLTLKDL